MIKLLIIAILFLAMLAIAGAYCCSMGVIGRLSRFAGQRVCIASVR